MSNTKLRRWGGRTLALLLLVGVSLGGGTTTTRAADPVTVRLGMTMGDDMGLNPFNNWGWYPTVTAYEYLAGFGPNYEAVPGFAESWSLAADNLTWTFKTPEGRKWSDGEPATARDAAFTLDYLLDSVGTPSELAIGINNAGELQSRVASVRAIDDTTLEIVTTAPSQFPLESLIWIVPEHVWKDVSAEQAVGPFQNPPPTVGTGPFVGAEYAQGQFLRLVRNPEYDRQPAPSIDEIVISYYETPDAMAQALRNGEIDAARYLPVAQYDQLQGVENITVVGATTPGYYDVAFNLSPEGTVTSAALRDTAFRDALGYALDKQTLVDTVIKGHGKPGVSAISPAAPAYYSDLSDIARTFDLEAAKTKLEAAGYVDSNGDGVREDKEGKPLELRLYLDGGDAQASTIAQYVVDWWGQAGISLSPTTFDYAALSAKMAAPADGGGDWDIAISGWWPYPLADKMLKHFTTDLIGATNQAYWSNPEFDALFAQQAAATDAAERAALVDQAARLIYTDAPMHVLYYYDEIQAYRTDRFEGWTQQPPGIGGVYATYYPEQTWLNLKPVTAAEPSPTSAPSEPAEASPSEAAATPAPTPGTTTGSTDSTLPILIAVVVLVVVVGGVLVMRRRSAA